MFKYFLHKNIVKLQFIFSGIAKAKHCIRTNNIMKNYQCIEQFYAESCTVQFSSVFNRNY